MGQGSVAWSTYYGYVQSMGGFFFAFIAMFVFLLMVGAQTFNNYWLSIWFNDVLNGYNVTGNQTVSLYYHINLIK